MSDRLTIGVVCTRGIGPGRGGRSANEDNYLVCRGSEARFRDDERESVSRVNAIGTLVAVADGMGGHEDGELASAAAVQAMTRLFKRGHPATPESHLRRFVLDAHRRLRQKAAERGPVRMGTTLTLLWVLEGKASWCHVGDSRLYHHRRGLLRQLTKDHTWTEFAGRDGRESPIDRGFLAQNFVYGSRGFGDDEGIRIDLGTDTGTLELNDGDRFVLCSDGLSSFVPQHRIADVLKETPNPQAAATVLVERALAAGSDDNVTVIVIRVDATPRRRRGWEPEPESSGDDDTLVPEVF